MKTFSYLWQYLAELFLEQETFRIKIVKKIKVHIFVQYISFFQKSCRLWDNVENISDVRQAANGNMAACCMLDE
jgi:hypothetical protein